MKQYTGVRTRNGCVVRIDQQNLLPMRRDLVDHAGFFDWGSTGRGSSQLALALVSDALRNDAAALRFYQMYMLKVVARLISSDWMLFEDEVKDAVARLIPEERVYDG